MIPLTTLDDDYIDRPKLSKQKKHSRTSLDVQFKKFSLTKQKTRHRTNYEWIGKTI